MQFGPAFAWLCQNRPKVRLRKKALIPVRFPPAAAASAGRAHGRQRFLDAAPASAAADAAAGIARARHRLARQRARAARDAQPLLRHRRRRAARHGALHAAHVRRGALARRGDRRAGRRAAAGHPRSHQGRGAHRQRRRHHRSRQPDERAGVRLSTGGVVRPAHRRAGAGHRRGERIDRRRARPARRHRATPSAACASRPEVTARRSDGSVVPGGDRRQPRAPRPQRSIRHLPARHLRAARHRGGAARQRGALPLAGRQRARGHRGHRRGHRGASSRPTSRRCGCSR